MKAFDLEQVYDEQISPLMDQIIAICKANEFPMFASFLYRFDPDADETHDFCTTHTARHGETDKYLDRCVSIVREGLPENRAMAFTITTRAEKP